MFNEVLLLFVVILAAVLLYKALCWVASCSGGYAGGEDCHYDEAFIGGKNQRLILTMQEPWFSAIKSGKKTVEPRVGSVELYKANVGKEIRISLPGKEKIMAKIVSADHYPDLESFVKKVPLKDHAPHLKTAEEALAAYRAIKNSKGEGVFDPAKVKEKGIVAVEVKIK